MTIKNKKTVFIVIMVILFSIFLVLQYRQRDRISIIYKTVKIDRGDILSYISATGTINPVTLVEVGSQISGMITKVHVDFNTRVKKESPLADIDPTPFKAQLKQAEADVKKVTSDVNILRKTMNEDKELYNKRLISKEEYETSKAKYETALSAVEQANAALEIAKSNLEYTTIRSPIHGIVVSRNVNIGQTVAASFQAPALFLIAEDLTNMKLDTNVNEADIGKVQEGQKAFFTVDAYSEQTFTGKVWQIRNAPVMTQNVVTYSVILRIDNKDLKLKPGMTANVNILVASRHHTLRVPRDALRFIPPPAAAIEEQSKDINTPAVVWTLRQDGRLQAVPITSGISDENFTELLAGPLKEGEEVVVEATAKSASDSQLLGPTVLPQPKRF